MTTAKAKPDDQIQEELIVLFRENLAVVLDDLDLSQSELARRIGRTPGYVCDVIRGRRRPNLATVALFARGLGVTASALLSPPPEALE